MTGRTFEVLSSKHMETKFHWTRLVLTEDLLQHIVKSLFSFTFPSSALLQISTLSSLAPQPGVRMPPGVREDTRILGGT
jgi:hypothetical protein